MCVNFADVRPEIVPLRRLKLLGVFWPPETHIVSVKVNGLINQNHSDTQGLAPHRYSKKLEASATPFLPHLAPSLTYFCWPVQRRSGDIRSPAVRINLHLSDWPDPQTQQYLCCLACVLIRRWSPAGNSHLWGNILIIQQASCHVFQTFQQQLKFCLSQERKDGKFKVFKLRFNNFEQVFLVMLILIHKHVGI